MAWTSRSIASRFSSTVTFEYRSVMRSDAWPISSWITVRSIPSCPRRLFAVRRMPCGVNRIPTPTRLRLRAKGFARNDAVWCPPDFFEGNTSPRAIREMFSPRAARR